MTWWEMNLVCHGEWGTDGNEGGGKSKCRQSGRGE